MNKDTRRMKRMSRNKNKVAALSLTSLVDVFTILVFFLLVNTSSGDVKEPPKEINLPGSSVDSKPRETAAIMITEKMILIQGESMMSTEEALNAKELPVLTRRLLQQRQSALGIAERAEQQNEVTILSHRTIPFKLVKKVMASCTSAGFNKISLAVVQKAANSQVIN
jgi:biopolymer transport protein ExbD